MFSLMVALDGVKERDTRQIAVEAPQRETLLVRWLTELLYFVDAEEMLFHRFEVQELSDTRLRASAYGERIDRERHELHMGIKAVTRHMLEITKEDGWLRATILFDI